jgi:uncharacterized protein (DUF1330 family)
LPKGAEAAPEALRHARPPERVDSNTGTNLQEISMAKAYWISAYRSIRDENALAAYARLAGPALEAAGGRFLARGLPARVYESGVEQRTVILEFDSVAQAIAAHDSPAYQQALRALGGGADRDLRIVAGVG